MKNLSTFFLAFLFSTNFLFSQNLNQVWSRVEYGDNLGGTNLICSDVDGDGQQEVIFGGSWYQSRHLFVAKYDGQTLTNEWVSRAFIPWGIAHIFLINPDADADQEIVVVLADGTVEIYDGTTKNLIQTFFTTANIYAAGTVGDFDLDGKIEMALCTENDLLVYDLATGQIEWQIPNPNCTDLATGDVDGDGMPEIISTASTGNGYVLDGQTGSVEWKFLGGFGYKLGLADTNNDNIPEIIGLGNGTVTIFDGLNHSPIGQFPPNLNLANIYVTDLEGDGRDEIFTGDDQWGHIRCFNAETQQELWNVQNPDHGVTNITVGDPDGDGVKEVIWGAGATSSGGDYLYFVNSKTRQIEYESLDLDGIFWFDAADLDGDEQIDYVVASQSSNSSYDNGVVISYNSNTFDQQWIEETSSSWAVINNFVITQLRDETKHELVVSETPLKILDGKTRLPLFSNEESSQLQMRTADIDDDGRPELIYVDKNNRFRVVGFDGSNFKQEWQSIAFVNGVHAFDVANLDADPALEIVFIESNGFIQIYDGKTKLLQSQIDALGNNYSSALIAADLEGDGILEIVVAEHQNLHIFNSQTQQLVKTVTDISTEDIRAMAIENLDSSLRKEIILYDLKLKVVDSQDFLVKWESNYLESDFIFGRPTLVVKDLFDDQHIDILIGTVFGAYHFSTATTIPDVVPPKVVSHFPKKDAQFQGINTAVKISFSEKMDTALLNSTNFQIKDKLGNALPFSWIFDSLTFQLVCQPTGFWPPSDTITVFLKANLADLSQNTLDGNRNGKSEGSPTDDFFWKFSTGSGVDTIGPVAILASATPNQGWAGTVVKLEVTLDDLSSVAVSGVAGGEYFINQIGPSGSGTPLKTLDNIWGSDQEVGFSEILTDNFAGGDHTIFIHGKDLNGNWGAWREVSLKINSESLANWPMYGQNPFHTGANENCPLAPPLKIKWTKTFADAKLKPVTYANGSLLLTKSIFSPTSNNRILACLDTASGNEKWNNEFGTIFSINPASYAYGNVYLQTCNNWNSTFLYCLDFLTGDTKWQSPFDAQWEEYLNPTIVGNNVYINGGTYGGIYSFDAVSGAKNWFTPLEQYDSWTPAFFNGVAYSFAGGKLAAHEKNSGDILWELTLPFDWDGYTMNTAPVIDTLNNQIFTTSTNFLHAVNLETHKIEWFVSGILKITPALKNGILYLVRSGKLEARDAKTGAIKWTFTGDNQLSNPPAVAADYVFVSSENKLFAVEIATGKSNWQFSGGGGAVTLAENLLFLTNPESKIHAFESGVVSTNENFSENLKLEIVPNPVSEIAKIQFSLAEPSKISVRITDVSGKTVDLKSEKTMSAGEQTVLWDARNFPAGIYFCTVKSEKFQSVGKIILAK